METPDWIGLTEAALICGMAYIPTRDRMLAGKFGTPIRVGTHWAVSRAAVEAYAAEQKAEVSSK